MASAIVEEAIDEMIAGRNAKGIMIAMEIPWATIYPHLVHNKTVVRGILGRVVATQGSGPYTEGAFDQFLTDCGIQVLIVSGDYPPTAIVVGRDDWDEDDLDELREKCSPDTRVYSQEMVFASMVLGADIFDFDEEGETILDFVVGHPALEYFHKDGLLLPRPANTDVMDIDENSVETLHVAFEANTERPPLGILGDMGYRVGKVRGLPRQQRREILWRTFRVHLTAVSPWTQAYINEWGQRCSPARLNKMCNVLTSLINTAEQVTARDMSVAIAEWDEDLQFLLESRADWLTHTH